MKGALRAGVPGRRVRALVALTLSSLLLLAGCSGSPTAESSDRPVLTLGAIPDQDRDRLEEIYGATAAYLSQRLGVQVEYRAVADYAAAVSQFRLGDLDLVWFGGLTGAQARAQAPGTAVIAQRDIDTDFHSVFLASVASGLEPVDAVAGLAQLRGRRFTYGSPSSTSGYLMPAWFLREAGVDPGSAFSGEPGFSGSHDRTIDLVASGSYEAGAVNEQVWRTRLAEGTVDASRVRVLWRSPAYHDYHWALGPQAQQEFGADLVDEVREALLAVRPEGPGGELLELFGCGAFVTADEGDYAQVEQIGRELGLLRAGR